MQSLLLSTRHLYSGAFYHEGNQREVKGSVDTIAICHIRVFVLNLMLFYEWPSSVRNYVRDHRLIHFEFVVRWIGY